MLSTELDLLVVAVVAVVEVAEFAEVVEVVEIVVLLMIVALLPLVLWELAVQEVLTDQALHKYPQSSAVSYVMKVAGISFRLQQRCP